MSREVMQQVTTESQIKRLKKALDIAERYVALQKAPWSPTVQKEDLAIVRAELAKPDECQCTCHPVDNPPVPCSKQYALSECRKVAKPDDKAQPVGWINELGHYERRLYRWMEEEGGWSPVYGDPQPAAAERNIAAWWKWFNGSDKPTVEPASTFLAEDALATGWRPLVFGDATPQPPAEQRSEVSIRHVYSLMHEVDPSWNAYGRSRESAVELALRVVAADRKARGGAA